MRTVHYFLIVGIVGFSVSTFQCYPYLAEEEAAGLLKAFYCRFTFSQILSDSLSIMSIVIHLIIWLAVSMVLYRLYMRFLHGRFP